MMQAPVDLYVLARADSDSALGLAAADGNPSPALLDINRKLPVSNVCRVQRKPNCGGTPDHQQRAKHEASDDGRPHGLENLDAVTQANLWSLMFACSHVR